LRGSEGGWSPQRYSNLSPRDRIVILPTGTNAAAVPAAITSSNSPSSKEGGDVCVKLLQTLRGIQSGTVEDTFDWNYEVQAPPKNLSPRDRIVILPTGTNAAAVPAAITSSNSPSSSYGRIAGMQLTRLRRRRCWKLPARWGTGWRRGGLHRHQRRRRTSSNNLIKLAQLLICNPPLLHPVPQRASQ
jgi:hypothetical protein